MAQAEAARLAAALRRLIGLCPLVDDAAPEVAELAAQAEALADRLASLPSHGHWWQRDEGLGFWGYLDHSPLVGERHPLAPPLRIERGEGVIVGTVTFSRAYEGPPGAVHGGFVAAAFDEVLGCAQAFTGRPGYTGTLTVRYLSPTPIETEVEYRGWVERTEGRKIFCAGTCRARGLLCAEAEAVFLSVTAVKAPGKGA